jgi:hypothetical protein
VKISFKHLIWTALKAFIVVDLALSGLLWWTTKVDPDPDDELNDCNR